MCAVALFLGNTVLAQGNWVIADASLSPSNAVLSSSGTLSASGSYTWSGAASYQNENHMATLTFALPPSVYTATGVPSLVYAVNNAPVPGVTFLNNGNSWLCEFGPNTNLQPGTKVIFTIQNMEIKDDKNYTDQKCSHFISFLSSPANETLADNAATSSFQTAVNGPLPVGLLNFDARLEGKGYDAKVDLRWTTTSEVDASHFIVERSQNALDWTEVTSVSAQGNTNTNTDYQAADEKPLAGKSFYRLKQIDRDNSFAHSGVRVINNEVEARVNIYPNPTSDQLNVQFSLEKDAQIEIKLLTVDGRVAKSILFNGKPGSQVSELNIGELANGVYEVNIYNNNELMSTSKVQKN